MNMEPFFYDNSSFFMNMGCRSNTVAMGIFTRSFLKITANLIDRICHYASHMNETSLNDSKNFENLKCMLHNIVQNVVRSLLSAGGQNIFGLKTFDRKH